MKIKFEKKHLLAYKQFASYAIGKVIIVALILLLFIIAMEMMRSGVTSSIGDTVIAWSDGLLSSPGKAFFASYLSGIIMLSGSTVAALGISLNAAAIIPEPSLFHILMGSRVAPNVILLFVGFLAFLKGRTLYRSIGLGFIEYMVTLSIILLSYLFSMVPLIQSAATKLSKSIAYLHSHASFIDIYIKPIIGLMQGIAGNSVTFLLGLVILIISIRLFDKFFAFINFEEADDRPVRQSAREYVKAFLHNPFKAVFNRMIHFKEKILYVFHPNFKQRFKRNLKKWLTHPLFAFILGLLVTALTMSNAVSVTLILPFYMYKTIDIRSVIPYIMGATISTYVDTLFLAVISGGTSSTYAVMLAILSTICTVFILGILYRFYLYIISTLTHYVFKSKILVIGFFVVILGVPALMLYL